MFAKRHVQRALITAALFGLIPCSSAFASAPSTLAPGAKDHTKVGLLQRELDMHGFHLTVDGSFGQATKRAVELFQRRSGLPVDGIVSSATWAALSSVPASVVARIKTPTPAPKPVLVKGSRHHVVVRGLQTDLSSLGFPVRADGYFGPSTVDAVRAFQSAHGVKATGEVGPTTWRAIDAAMAQLVAKNTPPPQSLAPLKDGASGRMVYAAQAALQAQGFPVTPDGSFGARTKDAVIAFQREHGLSATGILDHGTWTLLFGGDPSRGGFIRDLHYVVQQGDNAAKISMRFGVTIETLLTANNLTSTTQVKTGQTLTIPVAGPTDIVQRTLNLGQRLADNALLYLGVPYVWGGTTPRGFDCSGLVRYVAQLVGVQLPRTSGSQFHTGVPVKRSELLPGDLVFFSTYKYASHVGIYIGNNRFVTAPDTGESVDVQRLSNPYWSRRYIGARDIFAGL